MFVNYKLNAHNRRQAGGIRPDHAALYRMAEQQSGYFTARQAAHAGFSRERLHRHTRSGRFRRIARGVYRLVQYPASPYEDLFVSWLRCGPRAVVSHESALALYELTDLIPGERHITIPRTASRRRAGIRLHTNTLMRSEVKWRDGLAVTSVARTISDVARAGLAEELVRTAMEEGLQRGLITRAELLAAARVRGGRAAKIIHAFLNRAEKVA